MSGKQKIENILDQSIGAYVKVTLASANGSAITAARSYKKMEWRV